MGYSPRNCTRHCDGDGVGVVYVSSTDGCYTWIRPTLETEAHAEMDMCDDNLCGDHNIAHLYWRNNPDNCVRSHNHNDHYWKKKTKELQSVSYVIGYQTESLEKNGN